MTDLSYATRFTAQGATEREALDNIAEAIREYLQVVNEMNEGKEVREVAV